MGSSSQASDRHGPPTRAIERTTEAPVTPAQFSALSKKRMLGVLKRHGLAKGKSKARKDALEQIYRAWYEDRASESIDDPRRTDRADEPTTGRRPSAPHPPASDAEGSPERKGASPAAPPEGASPDAAPDPSGPSPRRTEETPREERAAAADGAPARSTSSIPPPWEPLPDDPAPVVSGERASIHADGEDASPGGQPSEMDGSGRVDSLPPESAATVEPAGAEPTPDARDDFELDFASERPPPGDAPERRVRKRVQLEIDIGFRSETNFYVGFSTDLSDGGLFVATVDLLPVGQHVDVYFVLPGGSDISVEGVVAWVRQPRVFNSDMQPGFGVRFTRISRRDTEAIEHFMNVREPLFYVD